MPDDTKTNQNPAPIFAPVGSPPPDQSLTAKEADVPSPPPITSPVLPDELNKANETSAVISFSQKPRSSLRKTIPTIIGLLILVAGVVAGFLLVQERQNLNQKAQVTPQVNYACTPQSCSNVGCNNSCTAPLSGYNITWTGSAYNVPYGCYAIKNKCYNVDTTPGAIACRCPDANITDPFGEGYDTCDLPDIERYFDRGPTTLGWDQNYCGTQQVDVNCGGSTSYYHSIADISPQVCAATPPPTQPNLQCYGKRAFTDHPNNQPGAYNLDINLEISPDSFVEPNQVIVYYVPSSNSGNATATGATLTDTLPSQVSFMDADPNCTHSGEASGGTITCNLNIVEAQSTQGKAYRVRVTNNASGSFQNSAVTTYSGDSSPTEPMCSINLAIESCPFNSTQAQVQTNATDPWGDSKSINLGENIYFGGFHDGNGQFADPADVDFFITGPGGISNLKFTAPYPVTYTPTEAGSYTFTGRTKNQSGNYYTEDACIDQGTFTVVSATGACLNILAYSVNGDPTNANNWTLISASDLSKKKAGDIIYFTVAGSSSSGSFDKARFRVNSPDWRAETTNVTPAGVRDPSGFYDVYEIPQGVNTFTVNAQVHHKELDQWF